MAKYFILVVKGIIAFGDTTNLSHPCLLCIVHLVLFVISVLWVNRVKRIAIVAGQDMSICVG